MQLRETDKVALIDIAKNTFTQPVKIWAYGSRVKGLAHETSDLDLVIISETHEPIDFSLLNKFKEKLANSQIPILIQVVDWYRIPDSFRANIQQDYEELFCSKSDKNP